MNEKFKTHVIEEFNQQEEESLGSVHSAAHKEKAGIQEKAGKQEKAGTVESVKTNRIRAGLQRCDRTGNGFK